MKQRIFRIMPGFTCFLIAAACIFTSGFAVPGRVTYTDKLSRQVNVTLPVKRAVLLTTYELIPALGIWDSIAATGRWSQSNDLMLAAGYDMSGMPSTGSGTDINMETMLKIRPDLVISWTFRSEQVYFMEKHGLTVISIYPDSMDELYDVILLHGRVFGKEKKAGYCISKMKEIFNTIKTRSSRAKVKKRILCTGSRPTSVSGSSGMNNDIIKLIGAANCASGISPRNCEIPLEKIIRWDPEVIFIWGNATYSADDILANPAWRHISAVKNRAVYKLPPWSTWSPRVAPATLWMAMKVYPELYSDINFRKTADTFMRAVFGIPYRGMAQVE